MIGEEAVTLSDAVKECLSGAGYKPRLYDIISHETKLAIQQLLGDARSDSPQPNTKENLMQCVQAYEKELYKLEIIMLLLGYWGDPSWNNIVKLAISRFLEKNGSAGLSGWGALRLYPEIRMFYVTGVALVAASNYEGLASLFLSETFSESQSEAKPIAAQLGDSILTMTRSELFNNIPDYNQKRVPLQEYLFDTLRIAFEDLLYLGREYELFFDRFEVIFALVCADLHEKRYERFWGPPGRFSWKYRGGGYGNPMHHILEEASKYKQNWPPIKAGLFDGTIERFEAVHKGFCQAMYR